MALLLPFLSPMATSPVPAAAPSLAHLIALARKGQISAFAALAQQFEPAVFSVAMRVTRNPADAEDVRQETYLRVHQHLNSFHEEGSFPAWVGRIAANEAVTSLRKRHTNRFVALDELTQNGDDAPMSRELAAPQENPEQLCARNEKRRILARAIAELDPSLRSVCLLRDVQNLSTEETAEHLGLSAGAVRTRLFRGRMKLRERLRAIFAPGAPIAPLAEDMGLLEETPLPHKRQRAAPRRQCAPQRAMAAMACGD